MTDLRSPSSSRREQAGDLPLNRQRTNSARQSKPRQSGKRHAGTRHAGRRHTGKRALVLAAAIAVPAFAAPADWSQLGPRPAAQELSLGQDPAAMPFEREGDNFPGSAFFYLEETPQQAYYLPSADPFEAPDESAIAAFGTEVDTGPAATPFTSAGSGMDKARALRCLSMAIHYEAASESEAGQRAVAQVVLNRVAHSAWPASVCGVVFEGSNRRTGCQFTFTCDGSMARQPGRKSWARAQRIAAQALAGEVYKPIGLATHYHTHWVNPYWAKTLNYLGSIGAHRFYKWKGRNGMQAAFTGRYAGIERIPAPNLGTGAADSDGPTFTPAPPATNGATNAAIASPRSPVARPVHGGSAGAQSSLANEQDYANSSILPGAGQVKEEFANSGQWKKQPGNPAAR